MAHPHQKIILLPLGSRVNRLPAIFPIYEILIFSDISLPPRTFLSISGIVPGDGRRKRSFSLGRRAERLLKGSVKRDAIKLAKIHAAVSAKQVARSVAFLLAKRADIQPYESIEDLVFIEDEDPSKKISGFAHHFGRARYLIARELWRRKVFIGFSVVETILFDCLRDSGVKDPVAEVFARIENFGLHQPGFVLYPLHSFGIMGLGFATFLTDQRMYFTDEHAGIAIFPQSNSDEVFMQSLKDGMKALKIRRKLPVDTLEHLLRQGPLKWMRVNPIMMVRTRSFAGSYYENQFLLLIRLQFATAYAMMLSSFQKQKGDAETGRLLSSSNLNNFQTLNLKHYLVFQARVQERTKLEARRIPMSPAVAHLAELAGLNIQLDPRQHSYRKKLQKAIHNALADAEAGFLDNCIEKSSKTVKARVFRKLFTSLAYFRKSFRETSLKEENTISLAVAFETLLTDGYAKGVTERIHRRVAIALKGVTGSRKMTKAVKELFEYRGACVHNGVSEAEPEWQVCRQAFIHCFVFVSRKSHRAAASATEPMREILRDI